MYPKEKIEITKDSLWNESSIKEINGNYHLTNDGILTRKDYNLLFENENGKNYIPVKIVDSLNIYSNTTFSSDFFSFANKEGFCVNIVDRSGTQVGRFIPNQWKRDLGIEMAQIKLLWNEKEHLQLAREFQTANLFNLRAVLRYYERRKENDLIERTIEELTVLQEKVSTGKSLECLMMHEAQARQKYFSCFNEIMPGGDFKFTKRTRRPPEDALNAMISFGNTLLYTRIANEIYMSSMDIRFGIIHSSYKRPENLNLDLADLFKPILVDRTIFTIINRRMLDEVLDFEEIEGGGIYMTHHAKRIFIREFENKLNSSVRYGNEKMNYAEIIRKEVKNIQNYFKSGKKYKPYRYVN